MSDSMGKAVWQAAKDGNEAELRRLIGLGGNVNWHHPEVRRRMCLAWAPASSPPLLLRSPSPPRQRPPCAVSPQPRRRWPSAADPPTRRAWHTRPRRRAPHPRVLIRLTPLALDDGSCVPRVPGRRTHSSHGGLSVRARRVRPTPPRVRGDRGQCHECKPRACPHPSTCYWSASMS